METTITEPNYAEKQEVFRMKRAICFCLMLLFLMTAAATGSATISVRLDSKDGPVVATLVITPTGSADKYRRFAAKVKGATGVHDLYLCFSQTSGDVRLDWWTFEH